MELRPESYQVKCPECRAAIKIPGENARKQKQAKLASGAHESKGSRKKRKINSSVPVNCPHCRAAMNFPISECGRTVPCLLCEKPIEIPPRFGDQNKSLEMKREKERIELETIKPEKSTNLWDDDDSPPPDGVMFYIEGVVDFPFFKDSIGKWFYLTILFALHGVLLEVTLWGLSQGIPMIMRSFGLSVAAMSLLTGSFAAAIFQASLEGGAAGGHRHTSWYPFDYFGWLFIFFRYLYLVAVAAIIGFIPYKLLLMMSFYQDWVSALEMPEKLIPITSALLVLPVWGTVTCASLSFVILSNLEQNQFFACFSSKVFKTIWRYWWAWGLVVIYTITMFVGWIFVRLVIATELPFISGFFFAPFAAAILMIYARLLGRLGFRISQIR